MVCRSCSKNRVVAASSISTKIEENRQRLNHRDGLIQGAVAVKAVKLQPSRNAAAKPSVKRHRFLGRLNFHNEVLRGIAIWAPIGPDFKLAAHIYWDVDKWLGAFRIPALAMILPGPLALFISFLHRRGTPFPRTRRQ